MLPREAEWLLKYAIQKIKNNTTLLNIGSSNKRFIKKIQPHIYHNLIEPLNQKDVEIINVDIKEDDGVDIVANILNKNDREKIKKINYQYILCSNVLEHVIELENFCESLSELLPEGGYLIITVPNKYPYHEDPIDTMFRPTINQLQEYFPNLKLVFGEIVDCGTVKEYEKYKRKINPWVEYIRITKSFIKKLMPFYKYDQWKKNQIKKRDFKANEHYLVTCAIFRKEV